MSNQDKPGPAAPPAENKNQVRLTVITLSGNDTETYNVICPIIHALFIK